MANYDAQINILVAGQRSIQNLANQLNAIEDTIGQIERRWRNATGALQRANIRLGVTGAQQPRGEGGRFVRDPDRQARFAAYADQRRARVEQQMSRLALGRTRAEAVRARNQINDGRELVRQTERRITVESRLNAAIEQFERRRQTFARGGGGASLPQNLQRQIQSISAAYDAAGGSATRNIRLVRALSNELVKLIETQNEYNRSASLRSKGFEAGRRLQERISEATSRAELPRQRVTNARTLATEAIAASRRGDQQAYSEAVRRATAAVSRLERESKELARAMNEQEREISRIAKLAPRSPVAGGINFPGSPRAIEAQRKQQDAALKRAQQGFIASPVLGAPTMVGSPKWIAAQEKTRLAAERALRAQERAAKLAEQRANTEAERSLKQSQKGYPSSPVMGTSSMSGSPKWIAAQERGRVAAERRLVEQRRAEERAARIQRQVALAAERSAEKALKEAQRGYPSSPILGSASMKGSPRWIAAQESAKRKLEIAALAVNKAAQKALKEAQKGYPASPVLGAATIEGSPRWKAAQESAKRKLESAAKAAERAAEAALREAQKGFPASPIFGTPTIVGSPKWIAAQEKTRLAAEKAFKAQEKAAKAAEGAANKEAERILRESQKGYPASPIMGTASMTGSPKWIAAQERSRAAAERRIAAQRRAEERAAKIQIQAAAAAERAADKALKEAQKGYPSSPILGAVSIEGSPRWKATQESARQKLEKAAFAINKAAEKALKEAQKGYPSSPILGTPTMVGSPKWMAAQERLRGRAGGGAGATGLEAALKSLKEARAARVSFLGEGVSPAEAIDKIVREFNTGKPEISNTAKNLVTTYASEITAGIPAVADAMKNLGIAGIKAIKKALRMASPSRVMLEIAKNQIDTYVGFLRAALPAVEAAAKAVGEAGTPKAAGIPKEAIRTPLTEKARTRPLTNEAIERNKITASFAASQITGPLGQLEQVQARIEDFINKTRTSVDLDKLFAGFSENARFNMAGMGKSAGPDFDKLRAALADFYQVPVELTPDLDRGVNAAKQAGKSADQLERYVLELVGGLENISDLFKTAVKLPTPSATVKTSAAATASIVIPDPWETVADTISNSAIDAAVAGGRQIEQGVNSITSSVKKNIIEDPWADVVSTGSGGAIPPNTPPGRRAGSAGDARNNQARQVKDLLGLDALADISRVSTRELEALSSVASELRAILDPTIEGFDRLDNQLRETIGSIDRQLQRRDPNADFLTRRFGPRTGRAISEGLIGGAFPLLFGQGAGASLGGLLGGAAGGFAGGGLGFGLSLVGTALGTQIDAIAQSATELGAALENPAKNFDALKEKSFFTSKALEKNIEKLVEYGDAASASALVQQDAIKQIGTGGIEDLRRLSEASDKLNRAWAELTRQIQVAIAGPLADLLNWVSALVNKANEGTRRDAATVTTFRGLSEKDQAAFNAEVNKRIQAVSGPSPTAGLVAGADANALAQPSQLGPTPDQISKIRAEVAKLFQGRSETKIEISLEAQAQSKVNSIQKQLESIDIFRNIKDQVKQVGREQEDLQKQSFELARSYEESIGEIRQRIEDEVAARRFANLQKANEIADQQGQNRIKQLQLESSIKASELQSSSDNPAFVEAAKQAAAIVSQFSLEQLSAEEEAAKIKRDAALEAKKIDFESVKFKVGIEKELSRLNIETAKRVADINQQVKRRNEEYDANKFRLEKTLAEIQLKNSEVEANIRLQAASSSLKLAQEAGDQSQIRFFSALKEAAAAQLQTVSTAQQDIAKISAPQKLQAIAGVKIQNVDFSSVLKEVRAGSALLAQQLAESLNGVDLSKAANLQNFKKDFDDVRAQIAGPLNQSIKEIQDSRSDEIRYINLISNGLSEINARKTIEIEKEIELQRVRLQGYIAGLENQKKVKGQSTATIQAINSQIKQFQGNIDALPGIRDKAIADARAAMQPVPGEKIATAYEVAGQKLDELINKENQAIFAAQTISDAFSGAFREIIAGTATAQEILSGFFQNLANSFADMAAQIIAEMIKMYILKQLLNLFGAAGGGAGGAAGAAASGSTGLGKTLEGIASYGYANGGVFANSIKPFAMGGVVNSPTLFKFANGGAMNTGVMGEAGPEAILPLSRGSDGKLGVSASGSGGDVNVTVNVDAKGTSVQGNDQSGNQLGRAISAAVQQEIIKQRRPGGLLNK